MTATSRGVAVISSGCGRLLAGPPLVYHEGRPELAADTRAEAAEQASIEQMQQRSVVTASGESIRVEFYGLARQRAATSSTSVAAGHSMTLGSLWQELVERFPRLAEASAADDELTPQAVYRINLDGQQFVTHPQTPIGGGQCVLVMSADVGG